MKEEHPSLLPWYASGVIGQRERQAILSHLEVCEECRAEVLALSSLGTSLRVQDRVEHVATADLVLYEEDGASLPASRRLPLERHLGECADCRQDLAILGQAHRESKAARSTAARQALRRRRWIPAAAAALVLVLAGAWWLSPGRGVREQRPARETSIVFQAPRRGAEEGRILQGAGPWAIRVLLPFGAAGGEYRVAIRPAGGNWLPDLGSTARADSDQGLLLILRVLPAPGRYVMSLRHDPPVDGEPFLYPFELLPDGGPGSDS